MFKIEPVVLYGRHLRLEPLMDGHAEALFDAASGVDFQFMVFKFMNFWKQCDSFADFRALVLSARTRPGCYTYAIVLPEGGVVGSTAYFDVQPHNKSLEIGATWIALPHQGTLVNTEAKLLMLSFAFETLGCVRVQLKTDARNVRSQRAIEKLGCTREGVLRKHMVCRDGFVRDTVIYSIIAPEWPSVKALLEERL